LVHTAIIHGQVSLAHDTLCTMAVADLTKLQSFIRKIVTVLGKYVQANLTDQSSSSAL
jgi:hypothetical protein